MRAAAPPLALLVTALASVATSRPYYSVSGRHTVDGVSLDEPVALDLRVRTTGDVQLAEVTDLGVELDLEHTGDTSALIEVYQLSAPFDGQLPDDATLLGDGMARAALGDEPGAVLLSLHDELNPRAPLHLVVVSDALGVTGDVTVVATAPYGDEQPDGKVRLEVLP